jgi:hypothetical protein
MKLAVMLFMFFTTAVTTFEANAEEPQKFRSPMEEVNYGIGVEVIRNYKNLGIDIDLEMVIKGMKDGLSGKTLIPDKELRRIMTTFQTEIRQKNFRNRVDTNTNKQ